MSKWIVAFFIPRPFTNCLAEIGGTFLILVCHLVVITALKQVKRKKILIELYWLLLHKKRIP